MKYPAPVANLIISVFAGKPVEKRLHELRIWQVWAEAVGPQIATKAKPAGIRDGILTIKVSSSSWMQQLSLMKPDIIAQLNILAGEQLVHDILFKSGRVDPLKEAPPWEKPSPRPLTKEEELWIEEKSAVLDDPELKNALCSLISRHLTSSTGRT